METRLATLADAAVLAALHAESFGAARWSLAQLTDSLALATTQTWLVSENAHPLGFILCQSAGGEAEILTICTAPAARRRGVAQTLLQTARAALREQGIARLFLEVAADNAPALALYEKSGFRPNGLRPRYYARASGFVDAVMLVEPLEEVTP